MPYLKLKHQCFPPGPIDCSGELWLCPDCGRVYRSVAYPNHTFNHWRRLGWIGRFTRGIR